MQRAHRRRTSSSPWQSESLQQAVELVERAEADGDLALLTATCPLPDADLDLRSERIGEQLFDAHQVTRLFRRDAHEPALSSADRELARHEGLGLAHAQLL